MLLADTSDGTWIAVAMAGVTTVGSVFTGAFALVQLFLNKRYDTKSKEQDAKIESLTDAVADCKEKHAECEDHHQRTNAALEAAKAQLKARDEKDRAELEAKIAALETENAETRQRKHDLANALQKLQSEMDAMNLRAQARHGAG